MIIILFWGFCLFADGRC